MMVETYPSPTVTFNVVWRAALKSERPSPRRRLIKRLRAATRPALSTNRPGPGPAAGQARVVDAAGLGIATAEDRGFQELRCRDEDAPKTNGA